MLKREDMMELTRRMTLSRTSFDRIAGGYLNRDGEIDGTFNRHFLKLSSSDRAKNLELAKAIPYARTNEQLREYRFAADGVRPGTMRQLLEALRQCGLKNDALMETFYEQVAEYYRTNEDYAVFVFHDRYDVPRKGTDKERQWESEEVYEYLICAVCPVEGGYEPGKPQWGFLYPSFSGRSANPGYIAVFDEDPDHPQRELLDKMLG